MSVPDLAPDDDDEVNCIRPLLALPLDNWVAAFECFFDDICDFKALVPIMDRADVLRQNLHWAIVSWVQNYQTLNSLSLE